MPKSIAEVCDRAQQLRSLHTDRQHEKQRIRALMDGGRSAVNALLGDVSGLGEDLPMANLVLSGITRLGQKLGRRPDHRVDPPNYNDSERARKQAEKRERLVEHYDDACWMDMLLPQVGRWLPGYAYAAMVVKERKTPDGFRYPHVELRDPFDTMPGPWGANQQPEDLAVYRRVDIQQLDRLYPGVKTRIRDKQRAPNGAYLLDAGGASSFQAQGAWDNAGRRGVDVAEYYDREGMHLVLPDHGLRLDFVENVLESGPQFVVMKRHAFNKLVGHYDQVVGLMAMMAKLNLLAQVGLEDATFAEALALDTPLPTPTGWTTMGEVEPGDLLLGSDGLPVEIIKTTDVQDDRTCYRVTFEDGTSVVASEGHQWMSKLMSSPMKPKVRTTEQMFHSRGKHRVPASKPWKLPEADLPIDPYMLGLWLGDGHARNAIITASEDDMPDVERLIVDQGFTIKRVAPQKDRAPGVYVSEAGGKQGNHGSGLYGKLRLNNLLGNKHVPEAYLRGSIDQRTELLQGLMDSDGCASARGYCSFTNTNKRIIDATRELLRSLGEVPVVAWREDDRARNGGYWLITFTARNIMPFRLARKRDLVRMHRRGPEWVTIRSIEKVDTVPVRCVAVAANNHLFLAGEGAHTTHNTNIFGEPPAGQYRRGRFAINVFPQGTSVQKMQHNLPYQQFEQINRIERQLRQTAGYPVTDDAQSPNSYVTGAGLSELTSSVAQEVNEYQVVIGRHLELVDAKRLEWDERAYGGERKPMYGVRKGETFAETYDPAKDINGAYRVRRVYGMMAGWDEPQKIVGGLQLMQGGVISTQTMQENLSGLDNVTREQERIRDEQALNAVYQNLLGMANEGDPRALMAAIHLLPEGEMKTELSKFFTPDEPEMSDEEAAMAEMMAGGGQELPQGAPPDIATVLSRLTQGGQAQGGVQTVGRLQQGGGY